MPNAMEIVKALRCGATTGGKKNCIGCPYFVRERLNIDWMEKLGMPFWESCDVDQIALDAAELIERMCGDG